MAELQVRQAVQQDCEQVAALLASSEGDCCDQPSSKKPIEEAVQACIDTLTCEVYVAEQEGRIVGYIAVHWIPFPMLQGREGYISDLLVTQDCRGCGIGRSLLAAVEDRASELGCARLMLNNSIAAESFKREFYQKNGFRHRTEFANLVKILGRV